MFPSFPIQKRVTSHTHVFETCQIDSMENENHAQNQEIDQNYQENCQYQDQPEEEVPILEPNNVYQSENNRHSPEIKHPHHLENPTPPPPPPMEETMENTGRTDDWMDNGNTLPKPKSTKLEKLGRKYTIHSVVLAILGLLCVLDLVATGFLAMKRKQLGKTGEAQMQVSGALTTNNDIEALRSRIDRMTSEALPENIQKVIQDSIALNTEEFENFRTIYESKMAKVMADVQGSAVKMNGLEEKIGDFGDGISLETTGISKLSLCNSSSHLRFDSKCIAILEESQDQPSAEKSCTKVFGKTSTLCDFL